MYVVEDDVALRTALSSALRSSGYEVLVDQDGTSWTDALDRFRPDVAVIDVRVPADVDGFGLAARIRAHSGLPILFVTAADALEDRLRGFDVGGDDYLVKPFPMAELLARVRAVLRRTGRLTSSVIEVRDLIIDEAGHRAVRAGSDLELTDTEFSLLVTLARTPGRVVSKGQLLSVVWGWEEYHPNLVEVHVSALRRKLEAHGPRMIHTERGAGYVLRE